MKGTSQQDKDLAARFAREVEPLFNVFHPAPCLAYRVEHGG